MGDTAGQGVVFRTRCGCGQRLRVSNARPDMLVRCPKCRGTIRVMEGDLRAGDADIIPITPVQIRAEASPQEAVPVDYDDVRVATRGSRPGLTGRTYQTDEDLLRHGPQTKLGVSSPPLPVATEELPEGGPRTFVADLGASFYLAGRRRNVVNLAALAAAMLVPILAVYFASLFMGPLISILGLVVWAIVMLYVLQFFWRTLTNTAGGDDDIPLVEPDWDFWDDGLKPGMYLLLITVYCAVPAMVVWFWSPPAGQYWPAMGAALGVGALMWPVAVMSVAIGDSLMMLRPDLLARCILGIGPLYGLACLMLAAAVGIGLVLYVAEEVFLAVPVIGPVLYVYVDFLVTLYVGYVVFRTLGLLYRHHRQRFPWKFE